MKYILTFLLFINFSYANYTIKYTGIELGTAKDFSTIKDGYIHAKITNSIAKFLLGKDFYVLHNSDFKNKKNKNTKYDKDKNQIILILKKAYTNTLKKSERIIINDKKYIDISFDKHYIFKYYKKGKFKSEGYFIMKDGVLQKLVATTSNVEIIKEGLDK